MADLVNRVKTVLTAEDKASSEVTKARQKIVGEAKAIATSFVGVTASVAGLVAGIVASVKAAGEQEAAFRRLERAGVSNVRAIQKQADALDRLTSASTVEIQNQIALARSMGASEEVALKFARAAVEAEAAGARPFAETMRQLIKSLGGFAGELGETDVKIKSMTPEMLKMGMAADALLERFAGSGEAQASGLIGATEQLRSNFDQLKISIGQGWESSGAINFLNDVLVLLRQINEIPPPPFLNSWGDISPLNLLQTATYIPGVGGLFGTPNHLRRRQAPTRRGLTDPGASPVDAWPGDSMTGSAAAQMAQAAREQADAAARIAAVLESLTGQATSPGFGVGLVRPRRRAGRAIDWSGLTGGRVAQPDLQPYTDDDVRRMQILGDLSQRFTYTLETGFYRATMAGENFFDALIAGFKQTLLQIFAQEAARKTVSFGLDLVTKILPLDAGGRGGGVDIAPTSPGMQSSARAFAPALELARRRGQVR